MILHDNTFLNVGKVCRTLHCNFKCKKYKKKNIVNFDKIWKKNGTNLRIFPRVLKIKYVQNAYSFSKYDN